MHRSLLVVVAALSFAVGCAHGAADDPPGVGSTSQRSQACLEFQKAYCDWDVDACHVDTRASCNDTATSLYCSSDDKATACTKAMSASASSGAPTASCGAMPAACNGVIDTKPAVDACNTLVDKYCDASTRCGQGAKSDCMTSAAVQLDCSTAIGASPKIDQCFSDLAAVDCTTFAQSLPTTCTGAIKVSSAASSTGAIVRPHEITMISGAIVDLSAK